MVKPWSSVRIDSGSCKRGPDIIGNPTVTRVVFFPNHINQRVGRVVLINHHEWRECNDRNE